MVQSEALAVEALGALFPMPHGPSSRMPAVGPPHNVASELASATCSITLEARPL